MQVRYGEGVAIHTGPEPCVVAREDGSEASAGDRIGQPLSCESARVSGADAVSDAEGNMTGRVSASARTTLRRLRFSGQVDKLRLTGPERRETWV